VACLERVFILSYEGLEAGEFRSIGHGTELATMLQQLVDQEDDMLPGLVALRALGAEGAHRTDNCISKNEPENGPVVSASEVARYCTHRAQVVFHSLQRQ
jgi:hypothetical protein